MLLTPHDFRKPPDQQRRRNRFLIEARRGMSKPQMRRQTLGAVKNYGNVARPEGLGDRRHVSIGEVYVENGCGYDACFQQDQCRTGSSYRTNDVAFGVLNRSLKIKRN